MSGWQSLLAESQEDSVDEWRAGQLKQIESAKVCGLLGKRRRQRIRRGGCAVCEVQAPYLTFLKLSIGEKELGGLLPSLWECEAQALIF